MGQRRHDHVERRVSGHDAEATRDPLQTFAALEKVRGKQGRGGDGPHAGEPKDTTREPSQTPSATNWVRRCSDVQMAAGTEGFISIERCYWGSPNVPELRKRVASRRELRGLLTSHAAANTALFMKYPPLLVWVPGVSTYHREAIEDYELGQKEDERFEESKGRHNTVWRLHRNAQGVPFLFTWHPSARLSGDRWRLIQAKVTELASASRRRMKLG